MTGDADRASHDIGEVGDVGDVGDVGAVGDAGDAGARRGARDGRAAVRGPRENLLRGALNRFLQVLALHAPGATTTRVWLHRIRGVRIGEGTFLGNEVLLETSYPWLVSIGERVAIGIRVTIVAHFRGEPTPFADGVSVRIEDDAFIGPGAIILPNVRIGEGAVVAAGSVVSCSVPPLTMVQGNPARPVARCGVALGCSTPVREFYRKLRPLG